MEEITVYNVSYTQDMVSCERCVYDININYLDSNNEEKIFAIYDTNYETFTNILFIMEKNNYKVKFSSISEMLEVFLLNQHKEEDSFLNFKSLI